jgi:hypothetical protein
MRASFAPRCTGLQVDIVDVKPGTESLVHEGSYLDFAPPRPYDFLWCSHVVEHLLNPGLFFDRVFADLREGGWVGITVPPLKSAMAFQHVTLWNAGLLLIHLIHAGFDCSAARVATYGDNVSVVAQKIPRGDKGKARCLPPVEWRGVYLKGDIARLNWLVEEIGPAGGRRRAARHRGGRARAGGGAERSGLLPGPRSQEAVPAAVFRCGRAGRLPGRLRQRTRSASAAPPRTAAARGARRHRSGGRAMPPGPPGLWRRNDSRRPRGPGGDARHRCGGRQPARPAREPRADGAEGEPAAAYQPAGHGHIVRGSTGPPPHGAGRLPSGCLIRGGPSVRGMAGMPWNSLSREIGGRSVRAGRRAVALPDQRDRRSSRSAARAGRAKRRRAAAAPRDPAAARLHGGRPIVGPRSRRVRDRKNGARSRAETRAPESK